ncbi:hypothetical protein BDW02DRAFT_508531 [Decorospora gaudefroyi]|uniref:Uncharacterized protein n=1 Tax=Decorospora gaudefroyi TaxID=184978 RepID=A0A6A5K9I1_9PLEO|nr:hypothetical protein BDW02DRAFT_508531 [Decorospora gaudefroyi]
MQLITLLSTASAIVATAFADSANRGNAPFLNANYIASKPYARIVNRCDYDVNLWSVLKGDGCPADGMVTLKTGESYLENLHNSTDSVGVSIKLSKTEKCKGNDITQLEYFFQDDDVLQMNFLDVSYVDCEGLDCPARKDGYYLVAGNQVGTASAKNDNTWCPILACSDAATCDTMSYVLPDDVQTKTCALDQNIDFYMCGSEAPSGDYESAPVASASSIDEVESSTAAPTSTSASSSDDETSTEEVAVAAAAVTDAPEVKQAQNDNQKTKTKVVYVTAYEYVNAKRHAHDHARRHQAFHA